MANNDGLLGPIIEECLGFGQGDYQYFENLIKRRTIILNHEISEDIIEKVIVPLRNFEQDASDEKVTLILNTAGGDIYSGALCLLTIIDNYKKPLDIIVFGQAFSLGTILLCAGTQNKNVTRICYPFSFGLLHAGTQTLSGNAAQVEDYFKFSKEVDQSIKDYILSNTKITSAEYEQSERHEIFLTAKMMKERGMIDKIIGVDEV